MTDRLASLRSSITRRGALPLPARLALNAALLLGWLFLFRAVFAYLGMLFTQDDFRTNQILFAGVLLLIVSRAWSAPPRLRLDAAPHLYLPALVLALVSATLYLPAERFLDVNTLSASLFGLATYGLLGLWMAPRRWREGFPALFLLLLTLPFGDHLQTFVGYPLRLLTASIVRDGLASAGVATFSTDTILVFETSVAQIDLPCSGVRSLWTGALFLIAAAWIERRPFNLRFVLVGAAFAGLLFVANLERILILVMAGQVAGWRTVAEMLHVPLGVLGFGAACVAALWLLRKIPELPLPEGEQPLDLPCPAWLAPFLAVALLLMALLYRPRPVEAGGRPLAVRFPPDLAVTPQPFTPGERDWLAQGGAVAVERWRFRSGQVGGSMILISSNTWRAQHRPERCFQVYGLSLEESSTLLAAPDFPLRYVVLGDHQGKGIYSAAYWLQSSDEVTDDFARRMWADLSLHRQQWVLVTVLFDRYYPKNEAVLFDLFQALRHSVDGSLAGGVSQ